MRHDKLERELHLLQLLTENNTCTTEVLCEKVGISRRNFYYYIEFFRDCGFAVYKRGACYCVGRDSPFFNRIFERISFTEDEAVALRRILAKAGRGNAVADGIRRKLERFYDFGIISADEWDEQSAHNVSSLYESIKLKRQAVLRGYASPHSSTVKDRLVEPFLLMNGNNDVRCYEPSSGLNKTFKVSRMADVEVLDSGWAFEPAHKNLYTDVFMFSGEERVPVSLTLGRLSYSVLREEYPRAMKYVTDCGSGRHRLDMDVCSYAGIGRFVLGLFDDVQVLGDDGFKAYLRRKIAAWWERTASWGTAAEAVAEKKGY